MTEARAISGPVGPESISERSQPTQVEAVEKPVTQISAQSEPVSKPAAQLVVEPAIKQAEKPSCTEVEPVLESAEQPAASQKPSEIERPSLLSEEIPMFAAADSQWDGVPVPEPPQPEQTSEVSIEEPTRDPESEIQEAKESLLEAQKVAAQSTKEAESAAEQAEKQFHDSIITKTSSKETTSETAQEAAVAEAVSAKRESTPAKFIFSGHLPQEWEQNFPEYRTSDGVELQPENVELQPPSMEVEESCAAPEPQEVSAASKFIQELAKETESVSDKVGPLPPKAPSRTVSEGMLISMNTDVRYSTLSLLSDENPSFVADDSEWGSTIVEAGSTVAGTEQSFGSNVGEPSSTTPGSIYLGGSTSSLRLGRQWSANDLTEASPTPGQPGSDGSWRVLSSQTSSRKLIVSPRRTQESLGSESELFTETSEITPGQPQKPESESSELQMYE